MSTKYARIIVKFKETKYARITVKWKSEYVEGQKEK